MHRSSKCKAQFFIISAALVIASISAVSFYLQSLYEPSLTYPSTKIELDYIPQIKKLLCEASKNKHVFSRDVFEKNLEEVERTLKEHLASQGIIFSVTHDFQERGVVFNFNLTSYGFKSQTVFTCFAPEERKDFEWQYRKPIIITEQSGNTLTDYQVLLTVDTQSLISEGKMRSDCGDIRFTWLNSDTGNEEQIPYWIESGCGTTSTKIWIKVPEIPANGEATVYMYYGNPDASSESNGDAVFEFFDDFEDGDISDWDTNMWGTYSGDIIWDNGRLRLRVYKCYNVEAFHLVGDYSSNPTTLAFKFDWETKADEWYESPGWKVLVNGAEVSYTVISGTNIQAPGYAGNKIGSVEAIADVNGVTEVLFRIYQSPYCDFPDHANTYLWIDNLRVRKYADPEPTYTIGAEERL